MGYWVSITVEFWLLDELDNALCESASLKFMNAVIFDLNVCILFSYMHTNDTAVI